MIEIFAVVNGRIIESLGDNSTPTYSNIHFLLNELKKLDDVDLLSHSFKQLPRNSIFSILCNNVIKTFFAFRSALTLIKLKPMVYFAYPHSFTTVQNRAIFQLCMVLKLNVVLRIHDSVEQADAIGAKKFALNNDLEGYYLKNAALILALNEPMWCGLEKKYKLPENMRVAIVPNAFDESICKEYPDIYRSIENRFNVCYVGGLTKNKGIDVLVKACEELHERYPYLRLWLFGSYEEGISDQLKNTIEKSGFINRIKFTRKDLISNLKEVDLFVMPYNPNERYLNFSSPTKFFEYIGTGKPILCTKCESLVEIGKNSGIIYVDYDATDFKEKIEFLIENPDVREDMSRSILNIRPFHTWKERAKIVHKALKSL